MTSRIYKPGEVVADQYRIKAVVGSGGFSRVYRAVETRLGREVALKIMSSPDGGTLADSDTVFQRFVREARLVSQLTNPHTITLYDYDTLPDGRLYMALEFVEGKTLEQLIEQTRGLAPERIRRIIAQVLEGLAEAHAAGVLHRDIKPSNVMLFHRHGRSDRVKLLDFGIAKKVASEDAHHDDLTVDGTLVGTPRYMSPEQIERLPLTPASDLYSVGLLIYEMWSGQSPFPSSDVTEIFKRMRAFDDEIGALASAPQPLERIGTRLLEPEPDDRFESAEEVLEALGLRADPSRPDDARRDEPSRAVPPSFPVGFDRAADTPSSELTGVDLSQGSLTAAAARQLTREKPAPDLTRTHTAPNASTASSHDPDVERQPSHGESGTETSPAEWRSETDTAPAIDRRSTLVLALGIAFGVIGLLTGGIALYWSGSQAATDADPPAEEESPLDRSPATTPSDEESDGQQTANRAIERSVATASDRVTDAAVASAGRADERAERRSEERTRSPSRDRPERNRGTDSTDPPADEPDESGGVTIEPFE